MNPSSDTGVPLLTSPIFAPISIPSGYPSSAPSSVLSLVLSDVQSSCFRLVPSLDPSGLPF